MLLEEISASIKAQTSPHVYNLKKGNPSNIVYAHFSQPKGAINNDLRSACNRLYGGRGPPPAYQSPQLKRTSPAPQWQQRDSQPNTHQHNVSSCRLLCSLYAVIC